MGVPGTPLLTDALWTDLAPLPPPRTGKRGRSPSDHRPILAGLLWMMHRGVGWREIPSGFGPWHTAYSRYQQWCRDGTWERIVASLPPVPPEGQLSLQY
jgi:transposase